MLFVILDQFLSLIKDNWQSLVIGGVGSLSVIGLLFYPIQKWIDKKFNKSLYEFQNKLDILKDEKNIKFDISHREMVKRLSNLFDSLAELIQMTSSNSSMMSITPEKSMETFQTYVNKRNAFKTNLIGSSFFLSENVENGINEIISLCDGFIVTLNKLNQGFDVVEVQDFEKKAKERFALSLPEEIPQELEGMVNKMRYVIAIDELQNDFNSNLAKQVHSLRDLIKNILGINDYGDIISELQNK